MKNLKPMSLLFQICSICFNYETRLLTSFNYVCLCSCNGADVTAQNMWRLEDAC